ncbi:MAG: ribonuclease III [Proteobacteria bacterium]|jgi:ribonuclease-3|nr:ribonuclease III [Pseudomonadota bacterium]
MPKQIKSFIAFLENILGETIKDTKRIECAFIHRSFINEFRRKLTESNERLEFLGDAVLDMVVTEELMKKFPEEAEGTLSKFRSMLVNEKTLAQISSKIEIGGYLKLGKGEEQSKGREKPSILSDTFEAIVGAIYLSNGMKASSKFIRFVLGEMIESVNAQTHKQDYKTTLQEMAQSLLKTIPRYQIAYQEGPDHLRTFETEVLILEQVMGRGKGRSKKESEQLAAKAAISQLKKHQGAV